MAGLTETSRTQGSEQFTKIMNTIEDAVNKLGELGASDPGEAEPFLYNLHMAALASLNYHEFRKQYKALESQLALTREALETTKDQLQKESDKGKLVKADLERCRKELAEKQTADSAKREKGVCAYCLALNRKYKLQRETLEDVETKIKSFVRVLTNQSPSQAVLKELHRQASDILCSVKRNPKRVTAKSDTDTLCKRSKVDTVKEIISSEGVVVMDALLKQNRLPSVSVHTAREKGNEVVLELVVDSTTVDEADGCEANTVDSALEAGRHAVVRETNDDAFAIPKTPQKGIKLQKVKTVNPVAKATTTNCQSSRQKNVQDTATVAVLTDHGQLCSPERSALDECSEGIIPNTPGIKPVHFNLSNVWQKAIPEVPEVVESSEDLDRTCFPVVEGLPATVGKSPSLITVQTDTANEKSSGCWKLKQSDRVDLNSKDCRKLRQMKISVAKPVERQDVGSFDAFQTGVHVTSTERFPQETCDLLRGDSQLFALVSDTVLGDQELRSDGASKPGEPQNEVEKGAANKKLGISCGPVTEQRPGTSKQSKLSLRDDIQKIGAANSSRAEGGHSPPYKYRAEPVRKKALRKQLKGMGCSDCEKYFGAENLTASQMQAHMDRCSRHRDKFPTRLSTPPGFWNPNFPDFSGNEAENDGC